MFLFQVHKLERGSDNFYRFQGVALPRGLLVSMNIKALGENDDSRWLHEILGDDQKLIPCNFQLPIFVAA